MQKTIKLSFLEALKKQEGFRFGTLWRQNKNVLGGIVPILKDDADFERGYVMVEEVKEKEVFTVTDTGEINKVKIKMLGNRPIFFRTGTMFKGQNTQSRASTISVVIVPEQEKEVEIPAKCIYASKGISGGASFNTVGTVPREVEESLVGGYGQGSVWANVSKSSERTFRCRTASLGERKFMPKMSDDLIDNLDQLKDGKKKITEIMKELPPLENQVGAVIFDHKGVYAVEVFDHPKSWIAFHENIIEKYEDVLTQESSEPLFKLDEKIIPSKITEFIDSIIKCEETTIFENGTGKSLTLKSSVIVGEYTSLNGSIIHVLGLRKEQKSGPERSVKRGLNVATLGSSHIGERYKVTTSRGPGVRYSVAR